MIDLNRRFETIRRQPVGFQLPSRSILSRPGNKKKTSKKGGGNVEVTVITYKGYVRTWEPQRVDPLDNHRKVLGIYWFGVN